MVFVFPDWWVVVVFLSSPTLLAFLVGSSGRGRASPTPGPTGTDRLQQSPTAFSFSAGERAYGREMSPPAASAGVGPMITSAYDALTSLLNISPSQARENGGVPKRHNQGNASSHARLKFVSAKHTAAAQHADVVPKGKGVIVLRPPATADDDNHATARLPNGTGKQDVSAKTRKKERKQQVDDGGGGDDDDEQEKADQLPLPCPNAWPRVMRPGAGLHNCGNTCFLNAVLQSLTHTPAIASICLAPSRRRASNAAAATQRFDAMEELRNHVRTALAAGRGAIQPTRMVRTLRLVSRSFRIGRQEDAHEYLRELLEACDRSLGDGEKNDIQRVFGGKLRSRIVCTRCKRCSDKVEPCLDISVDLVQVRTVNEALQRYTMKEILEDDNAYACERCRRKVSAYKQLTIYQPPNCLALHLKRFSFSGRNGGKISRHTEFPLTLDIGPHTSDAADRHAAGRRPATQKYKLHAVLVHAGHSLHSGHYFCYVKSSSGAWYRADDSRVQAVSIDEVRRQQAYILFYTREGGGSTAAASTSTVAAAAPAMSNGTNSSEDDDDDDDDDIRNGPQSTVAASATMRHLKSPAGAGRSGNDTSPRNANAFRALGVSMRRSAGSSKTSYDRDYDAGRLTKNLKRRKRERGDMDIRLGARSELVPSSLPVRGGGVRKKGAHNHHRGNLRGIPNRGGRRKRK